MSLAQEYETATILTYNLTYYRETNSFCNGNNNDANLKDAAMKKIAAHVKPDIMVCNEIGSNFANPNKLIENALNVDGVSYWKQGGYSNNSFSSIVNQLFYNSDKFELYSQDLITHDASGQNMVRVIDVYTLYYKDPLLTFGSDTTFLTVLSAHLKAGSSSSDKADRDDATQAVMQYIEDNQLDGNVFMTGDFNVQSSNEAGFDNLVNWSNSDYNFNDPINELGNWNNNAAFKYVHTQSTRVNSNGCLTGGGMDDRLDFILTSDAVMDESKGIKYINNSYLAVGQDGNRFNESIIYPKNYSVPSGVDTALYNLSDHLPVKLDFTIKKIPVSVEEINDKGHIYINSPVNSELNIISKRELKLLSIMDLSGKVLIKDANLLNDSWDVTTLEPGYYFAIITDNEGQISKLKFYKN